jgi:DNA-binding NarL/FixJ family response regulator
MTPIRVLLADDHAVLRDSLKAYLALCSDIQVVGEAAGGLEAIAQARALRPEILLLDLALPGLSGLEVLRRLARDLPECRVLILSQHDAPQYVLPALKAGARGYLLKRGGGAEVVQAIRAVARGESYLNPAVTQIVIDAALHNDWNEADVLTPRLTDREQEVLSLIADGHTNAEIGLSLGISAKTVDKHRAAIMRKLGITTRAGLVRYVLEKQSTQW